jgi:hypothetical protein
LTSQLQPLLYHKAWEARVAAGDALGQLAAHAVHHTAADLALAAGSSISALQAGGGEQLASLAAFNPKLVLAQGQALVASRGQV